MVCSRSYPQENMMKHEIRTSYHTPHGTWQLRRHVSYSVFRRLCPPPPEILCGGSPTIVSDALYSSSMEGAVEAWDGALTDTAGLLEGMIAAVREAGDAALALQVSVCEIAAQTQ